MSLPTRKTVVVPVDYSSYSEPAIRMALEFVREPSDVHVLHVAELPVVLSYGEGIIFDLPGDRQASATDQLRNFLAKNSIVGSTAVVREGDPGVQIADYAESCHADLIVIPSHGHHGWKRLLLGSVTERVLRHAHCDVFVLRRND